MEEEKGIQMLARENDWDTNLCVLALTSFSLDQRSFSRTVCMGELYS